MNKIICWFFGHDIIKIESKLSNYFWNFTGGFAAECKRCKIRGWSEDV